MRITILFGLGAAILSGTICAITYFSVRSSVLSQQDTTLVREAGASADELLFPLAGSAVYYPGLLEATASAGASDAVLYRDHRWFSTAGAGLPSRAIPAPLRTLVLSGAAATQTIAVRGAPVFAVGIWLPQVKSAYFELFSLREPARTLHILFVSLLLAAIVVTLGGAVLGSWAATRSLRPLHNVAAAALDIASGHLDTRLETEDYADLAILTSAFNRMADRLQERIEREISFTSDVNHELRSPLTTLAASLGVLESRREDLPERAQQALDLLGAEVRRFGRLVEDLLEISRLDAGLSDVNMAEVMLGDLVRRSVAAAGRPVPVTVSLAAEQARVLIDKRRFERILANLIDNAQHYAGGATGVVVAIDGSTARVAVEDEGPGIPLEERERIFDRFSRGSSGRRRGLGEGTGLGLAISAEHTRILGGRVYIEDNNSRGARFVVELPLSEDAFQ